MARGHERKVRKKKRIPAGRDELTDAGPTLLRTWLTGAAIKQVPAGQILVPGKGERTSGWLQISSTWLSSGDGDDDSDGGDAVGGSLLLRE